jgi:membrane-associated phospholipid phosphatase
LRTVNLFQALTWLLTIVLILGFWWPENIFVAGNSLEFDQLQESTVGTVHYEDSILAPFDSLDTVPQIITPLKLIGSDIYKFGDATLYTLSSPVRWRGKDWLKFGGVAAGVGLVSLADKKNQEFWLGENSSFWDGIERVGWYYGKPQMAIILSGGFYLTGLAAKNEWIRETGLILGSSFITTAALQTIFKPLIGRARPRTGVGNYAFDPLKNNAAYHSFPSGHMSVASSISFVLAKRINNPIAKIGFYSLAGTTLVSRMYSDSHWLSDMVMGGVITWFSTEAVIKRIEGKNRLNDTNKNISWELNPYPGGLSLIGHIK